jgi:predicted nucleic acid-binding protein
VVLYLLSPDTAKADRAENLLAEGGIVSVQVLNETAAVARRKMKLDWAEVDELLAAVKASCEVVAMTLHTHELALRLARGHQLPIYDALICASAKEAGAEVLWTEDLNSGQSVDGIRISNPFA